MNNNTKFHVNFLILALLLVSLGLMVFLFRLNMSLKTDISVLKEEVAVKNAGLESEFKNIKQKLEAAQKDDAPEKETAKTKKEAEGFRLLQPVKKEDNRLVYEIFSKDLKTGARLQVKLEGNDSAEHLRAYLSGDGLTIRLYFLSENGFFKPLYEFSVISYAGFNAKYSEVKPEITAEKEGMYLTEKLLNLEVDEENTEDRMAAKFIGKDRVSFEFIF